ncbi:MAG: amino acid ABC transporter substrate-binding protein, partial [Actinomycetota bacterium]|nr:amino acid ABC transporter substrate-binding protein [Actinomycetota bacterium]
AQPAGDVAPPGGGQAAQQRQERNLLDRVRSRGELVCGVNAEVPGFGFTDEQGNFSGFDVDYCKVIAAAVLGDAEAVEFRPLSTEQRFTALQAGEIDVLSRNTTYTASRDGSEGAAFVTTTFYDGQAMMVKADSEFQRLEDMQDTAICVLSGTTTELNLASRFAAGRIAYQPVPFEDNETLQQAFEQDRCDGWTSDRSQLAGVRSNRPNPAELRILDEIFSKEPLGPLVRDGDQDWYDAVNWAVIATIQAEEFGVTSRNVEQMKDSDNPEVRRFLGQPGGDDNTVFDPGLGLDPAFAVDVVSQVGNYGEIYDRNVGPDTPLGLERGLNALWTDGGLHYAPPYR